MTNIVERLRDPLLRVCTAAPMTLINEAADEIDRLRSELDEAKRAVAMWQAIHGNKPNAVEPSVVCEDCANSTPRSADGRRHESTSGIWACRNPVKITGTLKG